ncbi:MAG: hypothetical protein QNL43_03945 [Crocinitomicaceae bacterium]|jgi:hypothetical protein|tara:strand:- start:7340 stop:8020 length:681 start_codon:yes stop_codon:yes gene_type:complete
MNKSVSIIFFLLLLISCGKDQPVVDLNLYESYFPLEIGSYVDYQVLEVNHDLNSETPHDTLSYFLRTIIGDTITDNEGRIANKFIRKKRSSLNDPWIVSDVWTALINQNKLEVTEENQRKVWLCLPPKPFTDWDKNAYNLENPVMCNYEMIHAPLTIGNLNFDSVLTVEQEDVLNLVSFRRKYEQYANHVGLVNRYYKDLNILNFDTLNIQSGSEFNYKCLGFGIE